MCVIFWVPKERPTPYMVEKAFDHNGDGAGIAYREKNAEGVMEVVWKKGLDVKEMIELCATIPLPYVGHFRIASIGGVRPSLTHPFPITRSGSLALEGRTRGHVLFHNGHWKDWNDQCLRAAGARDADGRIIQIPMGRWSDTRAMAWLCAIYGPGFMEFLPDQKGIIFGPTDMQIFDGNGWEEINKVWCSNKHFMHGHTVSGDGTVHTPGRGAGHSTRFCKFRIGAQLCYNQTLDTDGYCFMHPKGVIRNASHSAHTQSDAQSDKPEEKTTVMGPATGGSRVPPSPFVQRLPLELPENEVITIELAEYLFAEKQISRNLLKRIKKHWERATRPKGKSLRSARALKKITTRLTRSMTQ